MSLIKVFKKSEKGSITLMVLTSMIFVLVVVTASYFSIFNKSENQDKKISKIAQQYRASAEDMEQEYINTLNDCDNLTIEQAQNNSMISKTTNTKLVDAFGNQVVVPAGFKITKDATNVTQGMVIEDKDGNQFVWIPVGDIYTDIDKTESGKRTIKLSRYTFEREGNLTDRGADVIDSYFQELSESSYGNAVAKDLDAFITSAKKNHGYYIGRYEAGVIGYDEDSITTTNNNSDVNWTGYKELDGDNLKLACKLDQQIWNYVTQSKASELSRNMYNSSKFTSDLINSYAWDTAIVFIQTFGTESNSITYSYQVGKLTDSSKPSMAGTGILSDTGKVDKQCNIFDMAGNCSEWTTETSSYSETPCISRGCYYSNNSSYTSLRVNNSTTEALDTCAFRPLLYFEN